MQRWETFDGQVNIGKSAIFDTMKDLILDTVGSLIATTAGYFIAKKSNKKNESQNDITVV
jgi:hypothetical protein